MNLDEIAALAQNKLHDSANQIQDQEENFKKSLSNNQKDKKNYEKSSETNKH